MDRTHFSVKPPHSPTLESPFRIDSALVSTPTHDAPSAVFAPLHYEPSYAYPLIVWLHGGGGDERQLLRIMPLVSMRNYLAVAPRGVGLGDAGPADGAFFAWDQSEATIQEAEGRVLEGIETAAQKFHVNHRRIFLAGFDCGGTMAFRVAMRHSGRFAGVLSLGGPFPRSRTPLGNLAETRRLPVFLGVGRGSRQYPAERVCDDLRLFHSAGLSVTLRQYPCGHELSPQMLTDVDRWIIEQITSVEPSGVQWDHEWNCEAD